MKKGDFSEIFVPFFLSTIMDKMLVNFLSFTTFSINHEKIGKKLLSPKGECTS